MITQTPEFGRPSKPGLQRSAHPGSGLGYGTPAPGEGFALTIAHRECAKLNFARSHDRHDVELGVALVGAKRASLVGRGPILDDVHVAMDLFGLRGAEVINRELARPFSGLAHSYVVQRRFVDAVSVDQLIAPVAQVAPITSH
jgi:hypothetical protein